MRETGLNNPPGWLIRTVDIYAWGIIVLIFLFALGRRLLDRRHRRNEAAAPPAVDDRFDKAATTAAYLSVVYVIAVAAMSGTLLSRTAHEWEPATPTSVAASVTMLSLAIPTLALIAQLRTLPHGHTPRPAPGGSDDAR